MPLFHTQLCVPVGTNAPYAHPMYPISHLSVSVLGQEGRTQPGSVFIQQHVMTQIQREMTVLTGRTARHTRHWEGGTTIETKTIVLISP